MEKKLTEAESPATKHPDYDKLKEKRDVVRAMIGGLDAVLEDVATYLPQYEGETDQSYELRKNTATFNAYTRKAVKVMSGMVFAEEIDISGVPADIQTLMENVDKEGNHLNKFAQRTFEDACLIDGYGAIVVDKPSTIVENRVEQRNLDLNPFARFYNADSIWNWSYRINPVSKAKELDMIDFKEVTYVRDGFVFVEEVRYRVYQLDGNTVTLQTWKENEKGDPEREGPAVTINTKSIPTPIAGEIGCDPPLYDIAHKNREHFQLWSIMKSDAGKTMVPQRVIEGGSSESIAPIGGDVTLFPPAGMKAYFIEPAGASLAFVLSLCEKVADDIALMTQSIISGKAKTGPENTATEAVIDHSEETAELKPMAEGYKDTLENMLLYFAQFMNKSDGGTIVLGTQWNVMKRQAEEQKMREEEDRQLQAQVTAATAAKTEAESRKVLRLA